MLGNCEKMLLISSASNEWPKNNQIDDPKANFNSMASVATATGVVGDRVMDQKVAVIAQDHHQLQQQQQKQQNQELLRCPRCDSTNTKFCYYNNYSLSQPRHFCKACKRYWTRGGTLRNVPVGGGCRKNKRVRRPPNSSSSSTTSLTNNNSGLEVSVNSASSGGGCGGGGLNSLSSGGQIHDLISSASNHVNHPLFYGLPTNHSPNSDINFPFSRYDLQNPPLINGLGLGFSSGLVHHMNNMNIHNHPQSTKQIFQDLISSNPLLSNYANSSTTTTSTTTSPTISSLLASSLHQIKGTNNFQTLFPSYEDDLHMKGNGSSAGSGGMFTKGVKMEFEGQNRSLGHHHWNPPTQNQMDQNMSSSSEPSVLWGSSGTNFGAWLDPSNNLSSSVPSLI